MCVYPITCCDRLHVFRVRNRIQEVEGEQSQGRFFQPHFLQAPGDMMAHEGRLCRLDCKVGRRSPCATEARKNTEPLASPYCNTFLFSRWAAYPTLSSCGWSMGGPFTQTFTTRCWWERTASIPWSLTLSLRKTPAHTPASQAIKQGRAPSVWSCRLWVRRIQLGLWMGKPNVDISIMYIHFRKGKEAPTPVCGEAAEHGDSRGSSSKAGMSRCGYASSGHLLEKRQRDYSQN